MPMGIYGEWDEPYSPEVNDRVALLDAITSRDLRLEGAMHAELWVEELVAFWESWANSETDSFRRYMRQRDAAAAAFFLRGGYEAIFGPIRAGEGFRSGTAEGIILDSLRVLSVVGMGIRLLAGGMRLIGISQAPRTVTCAWCAVAQAVRSSGLRFLIKLSDLFRAASRVLTEELGTTAVLNEQTINWIYRGTDLELIRIIMRALRALDIRFVEHSLNDLVDLVRLARGNARSVFTFGILFDDAVRGVQGHIMHATRVAGRTVFFDTNGATFATLEALEQAYPAARIAGDVPVLQFENAFIVNLAQVEAAAGSVVAPAVMASGALTAGGAARPDETLDIAFEVIPANSAGGPQLVPQVEGPHVSYRPINAREQAREVIRAHEAAPFLFVEEMLDNLRR